MQNYNPRYLLYCKLNSNSPEDQYTQDIEKYPGGMMCGFILFISEMVAMFRRERPDCFIGHNIHNQGEFTIFIENYVDKSIK